MSTAVENMTFAERTLSVIRTDLYEQQKDVQGRLEQVDSGKLRFETHTAAAFRSQLEYRDRLIARRTQLDLAVRGIESGCHWVARDFYEGEIATLQATLADYVEEEAAKRRARIGQMQLYVARLT